MWYLAITRLNLQQILGKWFKWVVSKWVVSLREYLDTLSVNKYPSKSREEAVIQSSQNDNSCTKLYNSLEHQDTLDGRNSAPVEVGSLMPLFTRFFTFYVTQDFFHQPYLKGWSWIIAKLPCRELTYPTLGKENSYSQLPLDGICYSWLPGGYSISIRVF